MVAQVFKQAQMNLSEAYSHSVLCKGDSSAKSSVFSKQSVIDELILAGFASK